MSRNDQIDARSDMLRRRVRRDLSNAARRRDTDQVSPRLSLRARRRNPDGAEFAVDIAARGWPAVAGVAVLALVAAYLLLSWLH